MALVLTGCPVPRHDERATPVPPAFPAFARAPDDRPTISSGWPGTPVMAFDPNVYVDAEGYHLFFTVPFCRQEYRYRFYWNSADPGECEFGGELGSIAYAFSADRGLTWEFRKSPVVLPGHSGFDSRKIETPYVFRLGDTLFMAYSADGDVDGRKLPARFQIGVARLELGGGSVRETLMDETRRFERRSKPLLTYDLRPGRFDNNVQEPSVVVRGDEIELYYVGLGIGLPDEPIHAPGQRISSVALGRAVLDRDLNVVSRSQEALVERTNIAEVRYFDGAYHMFATSPSVGEFHRGESITYSKSADGVHWGSPVTVLAPGAMPTFDSWGLMAPTVAVDEDRVVLFYTAFEAVPRACFPVVSHGRFGMPVAHGSKCLFATVGRAESARRRNPD